MERAQLVFSAITYPALFLIAVLFFFSFIHNFGWPVFLAVSILTYSAGLIHMKMYWRFTK